MITLANTEGFYYKPRVDKELLEKYNEGLIAFSACLRGEIPCLLMEGKLAEAKDLAKWYKDVFENRFILNFKIIKLLNSIL